MAKLTERKRIERKLDKAWSIAIRERDDHTCLWCGKPGTQACHVIPRRHRILRWNLDNGWTGCYACHNKWHSSPLEGNAWFEEKYPEKWLYVFELKNITIKWSLDELEEMLEGLE